jgi:hypothetical protein
VILIVEILGTSPLQMRHPTPHTRTSYQIVGQRPSQIENGGFQAGGIGQVKVEGDPRRDR